ncbi:MAG: uracil-DNA glycosylase [Acetobacteraceae bacterium]|nr:uracil-DNA glycosylase [Acetobacteraceae bacterium]
MTPDTFLAELARLRLDAVFNPYSDRCPDHDLPGSHLCRLHNLEAVLRAAWAVQGGSVWVARDLGYRGGRRTGLPLTDEVHLAQFSAAWGGLPLHKATTGPVVAERTAAVIWAMLRRVGRPVFLWNLFPLHPHQPSDPMSNRSHTAAERRIGETFLVCLLEALKPERIVAIGNDAAAVLQRLGLAHAKVRHPSHGGQAAFCDGIAAVYGLHGSGSPTPPCLL